MGNNIKNGYVEQVPVSDPPPEDRKAWLLPVFSVHHPKKGKICLVFDSSAQYMGISLNSVLLQGPDRNNCLHGVLSRFREGEVAFMADIESMFHRFQVAPEHHDYLHFFWFQGNDPSKPLIEYRATVHIFGNSPSPAVANYGLRRVVMIGVSHFSQETLDFIQNHFYVDDGLGSAHTPQAAIEVLSSAKILLAKHIIRLHKIFSNHSNVLKAFPESERASYLVDLNFDEAAIQRALGIAWGINRDMFVNRIRIPERPFTQHGVLGVVNTIYDVFGCDVPVILGGRLLQCKAFPTKDAINAGKAQKLGWDDPLPPEYLAEWNRWKVSLDQLHLIEIPRPYAPKGFGAIIFSSMNVFCDASQNAIGHVIYLRSVNIREETSSPNTCTAPAVIDA